MEQLRSYGDERQWAQCVYCAGPTETRDHVPSKVLLDEPYPENLPVVPACEACNQAFSLDEEYLACLVDCALTGSASPDEVHRHKVRGALARKPALVSMLTKARKEADTGVAFVVDVDRVRNVVLKLARGHAAYELNEPQLDEPTALNFIPLTSMDPGVRSRFETPPQSWVWPEVGSRAMQRLATAFPVRVNWIIVQSGRYRYMTAVSDGIVVRMVLSEYLGCEVVWSPMDPTPRELYDKVRTGNDPC